MPKKFSLKRPFPVRHSKVVYSIFATVGVVAVWRGIWTLFDSIPALADPFVAFGLAMLVLVVATVYFKFTDFR